VRLGLEGEWLGKGREINPLRDVSKRGGWRVGRVGVEDPDYGF
jgi:hypothetical protein